nr:MAG TPA: hypothetical protein [Caudoviricetes sp.]
MNNSFCFLNSLNLTNILYQIIAKKSIDILLTFNFLEEIFFIEYSYFSAVTMNKKLIILS